MQKNDLLQLLNRYKQGPMSPVLIRDLFNASRKLNIPIPQYNSVETFGIVYIADYTLYEVETPVFDADIKMDHLTIDSCGEFIRGWASRVIQIFKECNFNYQVPPVIVAIHNYDSSDLRHHVTGYQLCFEPNIILTTNSSGGFRIQISRSNSPVKVNFDFPIKYFADIAPRHEKIIKFFFEYWLRDIKHQRDSPFVKSNRSRFCNTLSRFTDEFRWMDQRKSSSKYYGRVIEQLTPKQDSRNQEIFQYYYDHAIFFKSCLMDWGFAPTKVAYFEYMNSENCKVIFCCGKYATIIELHYHVSTSNPYCKLMVDGSSVSLNFVDFGNKVYLDFIRIWLEYFIQCSTARLNVYDTDRDFRVHLYLLALHYSLSFKSPLIKSESKSSDFKQCYQGVLDDEIITSLETLKRLLGVTEMAHVYGKDEDNINHSKNSDLRAFDIQQIYLAHNRKTADQITEALCYLLDKEVIVS